MGLTFRERILRTFERRRVDRIVWQPRIYYWFYGNRLRNKLPNGYTDESLLRGLYEVIRPYKGHVPEEYRNMSMLQVYDHLGASPRYPQETLGVSLFRMRVDERKVRVRSFRGSKPGERITIWETPVGKLREVTVHGYHTEYPVKTPEDYGVMEFILDNTEFVFDYRAFEVADRAFGPRGVVQTFYPRSPLQRLIVDYMGFERAIVALHRHRRETERFMEAIERWDDKMYEALLESPVRILNFGENVDARLTSPRLFEEYLVPYYNKRIRQIHSRGKFCHIHMDGYLKPLLPLLEEVEFDGIEAATPKPQGDVTLEELKDALGDKILLDGIPAIMFLPDYPLRKLEEFARKVLEMFSPNLILGVSDEVPPTADITRVKRVSQIVEEYEP